MIIQINNQYSGAVILEGEYPSLRNMVIDKIAQRADLSYANLSYANLSYANLSYANLSSADLSYANLSSADLSYADLSYANLRYANLSYANLSSADLSYADLPAPTILLLASWGSVSEQLCADLMLFDSGCHPDPSAFQRWANGGDCPYDGIKVQRAAHFSQNKGLWGKGVPCSIYDLMTRLIAEKCKNSEAK